MTPAVGSEADLLADRLELLRLRTLLVGSVGMFGLVLGLAGSADYGSHALKVLVQVLIDDAGGFHVPGNLFQLPPDEAWSRTPVLLALAFAAIGIGGIVQMTRQALGNLQVRLWLVVLLGLAAGIVYTQADFGSVGSASQRNLVAAVRAREWARVEQLSSASRNPVARDYLMAQVGMAKPDAGLLRSHGKPLVDRIDDTLLHRGQDREARDRYLYAVTDEFRPRILRDIDVAVYGAPHTEIGLRLAQSAGTTGAALGTGWAMARDLSGLGLAVATIGAALTALSLWRRMARRLRSLRQWVVTVE